MATFTWTHQGTSDTTIAATDIVQFASGTFDSKITVGEYNDSTHTKTSGDSDKSSGNTPNNVKYVSSTEGDWGDGTEVITNILDAECTLKVNFSDASSVATSDAIFYAYDGTTTTSGPTGVTFQAFESGDSNWTAASGSGSAVSLTDQAAATSHDFFIATSASPDSVGLKDSFTMRCELTYS